MTTLPSSLNVSKFCLADKQSGLASGRKFGAGNETRTRDPDLGKVVLYQLSYSRVTLVFQPFATFRLDHCKRGAYSNEIEIFVKHSWQFFYAFFTLELP